MALVSEYQGFIFDYGGVLAHHQTDADQIRMAEIAGIAVDRFTEHYWLDRLDYDKGLLSGTEYWQNIARREGTTLTARAIQELTEVDNFSWMQFDSIMWDWIEQLRTAGKHVAMLSNMPRDLGEALRSRTDRLECFHHVTLSYELGAAKPEPAIYEHCLNGIGTPPGQTLFLDDRIANVHGAERLGVRAIQFTSREDVLPRLLSGV
jgi:putative hydrolase of the HAD superfamily